MTRFPSRFAGSGLSGHGSSTIAAIALLLALAAGCAGATAPGKVSRASKPSTVSDADYGRLAADQTQPVDDARAQLALARDELGRAKLSVVNDQHEGELARSDQATATADVNRAATESKIGVDSNEPDQLQQAREDTKSAQQGKEVADARLAYSKKLAASQAAQVTASERKVDLMTEKVNLAKLQSLDEAAVPAAGKYDRAAATERVQDAQRAYEHATRLAATASDETSTAKAHWKDLDQKQSSR